jgi:hypothetical protein
VLFISQLVHQFIGIPQRSCSYQQGCKQEQKFPTLFLGVNIHLRLCVLGKMQDFNKISCSDEYKDGRFP